MRRIEVPELAVIAMVGVSGSGKSTFARKHFKATEILSSDHYRGVVSDDETDQSASGDAFDALYYLLGKRLARAKLTVVDATNVRSEDRKKLVEHARKHHTFAVAIVVDTPEHLCHERNATRPDRQFGPQVVHRQYTELRRGIRNLEREGFRYVHIVKPEDEIEIVRTPSWNNKKHETGPFDIIGDVHGCAPELRNLLSNLGYERTSAQQDTPWGDELWLHPQGRRAIFVGDLVDRGPEILNTVRIVRNMMHSGAAFCVAGNHDFKLVRWLRGKKLQVKHGLQRSIDEIAPLDATDRSRLAAFLDSLLSHYVFDGGKLVIAHAGLREEMHGRTSGGVREFCLYGETTGETDEFGLPIRYNWAAEYRGRAMVVYGHTPVPEPQWVNNTANIDTGAVFGGALTALRYPEREFVSVPAAQIYAEPIRPIKPIEPDRGDVLDIADVTGKRFVETRLARNVTIREENSIAALEVMSRFATDPHWLIYLPPTMSPCETSKRPDYLEYPTEAFDYFRRNEVRRVICQEKHMGSRAVVVVCRDEDAARRRFGVIDGKHGVCYTRTGRPFFPVDDDERALIARVQGALTKAGFWEEFRSDWFCLDCELMPWSAKARELILKQYAAVGAAGEAALSEVAKLRPEFGRRLQRVRQYREAYRRYCWPVESLDDYKLAPFHLLASEGAVHADKTNLWHMQTLHRLAAHDPILTATRYLEVDVESPDDACKWWEDLTRQGGEGMVIKPLDFVARGPKGNVQPALKCRGREYLRIIYGPEYTAEDQIERLRSRALGGKRSLAMREFALGVEALERFVAKEPLRRVHECVFGVLALETEPVDPRL